MIVILSQEIEDSRNLDYNYENALVPYHLLGAEILKFKAFIQ